MKHSHVVLIGLGALAVGYVIGHYLIKEKKSNASGKSSPYDTLCQDYSYAYTHPSQCGKNFVKRVTGSQRGAN